MCKFCEFIIVTKREKLKLNLLVMLSMGSIKSKLRDGIVNCPFVAVFRHGTRNSPNREAGASDRG